jgi:hypothetical protein
LPDWLQPLKAIDMQTGIRPNRERRKTMRKIILLTLLVLTPLFLTGPAAAETAGFEDLDLAAESYWNGSDGSGDFKSDGASFNNNYNADFESWDGFAYSNLTDTQTSGFSAQYNAIAGSGAEGSETYAVAYVSSFASAPPTVTLDEAAEVEGAFFTNSNYAYYSMKNGDQFAREFTESDWFELTITGIDAEGSETGSVRFLLADGTNIIDSWQWVDLSSLGPVKKLTFSLDSTDQGEYGMNTPAYFCMDNLEIDTGGDGDSTCFIRSLQ